MIEALRRGQETETAVAGVRPGVVQIEQRGDDLGYGVVVDASIRFLAQLADGDDGRILAESRHTEAIAQGVGKRRTLHLVDDALHARPALAGLVGKKAAAIVAPEGGGDGGR